VASFCIACVAGTLAFMQLVAGPRSASGPFGTYLVQNGFPVPCGWHQRPPQPNCDATFTIIHDVQFAWPRPVSIAVDAVFSLVILGCTVYVAGRYISDQRKSFQFRLGTLFGWTAVVAVACGLIPLLPHDEIPLYVWAGVSFGVACTLYTSIVTLLLVFRRAARLIRSHEYRKHGLSHRAHRGHRETDFGQTSSDALCARGGFHTSNGRRGYFPAGFAR
jgi:hypothetical protein